jgi:hypothetical protein
MEIYKRRFRLSFPVHTSTFKASDTVIELNPPNYRSCLIVYSFILHSQSHLSPISETEISNRLPAILHFKMPSTLLTGANSFVAAHILDRLISAGHHVTGSVRNASKGQQILDLHPDYAGHLDFVTVEDYAAEGAWDEVFKTHDFDYIVHTAAPLLDNPANTDFDRDFLRPSVEGYVYLPLFCYAHLYLAVVEANHMPCTVTPNSSALPKRTPRTSNPSP